MQNNWNHTHFAALDWASDHHDLTVVDRTGQIVAEFRFAHTAAGWGDFDERMKPFAGCPLALETSSGPAVDQLLQRNWSLYPVNPKSAERYRERKAPSGSKTDRHDAWSLADALRTDGHAWRQLQPDDEATIALRLLCRDEHALIEQRTCLVNQLVATLREYYPAALEAFDNWALPSAWALITQFPDPQSLQTAGKHRWEKFLHTHKLWRPATAEKRLAIFARANDLRARPAVVKAKSLHARSLARVLQALELQLNEYRQQINQAFKEHPDHDIFGSLPGAGEKIGPRLLGELGTLRELFPDADALCCYAGMSPVSFQSGQVNKARVRWGCNTFLRHTVHLWADLSRQWCPWAAAYYQGKRENKAMSHASALRCLGKRWLRILWRMWQNGQAYDESFHLKRQAEHGSWVTDRLQLI